MCAEPHPAQHGNGPGWEQLGSAPWSREIRAVPAHVGQSFWAQTGAHSSLDVIFFPLLLCLFAVSSLPPQIPILLTTGLSQRKYIGRSRRE